MLNPPPDPLPIMLAPTMDNSQPQPDVLKVSILGSEAIHVGFHLMPYIVSTILTNLKSTTYVIVTDTTLGKLYLNGLLDEFSTQTERNVKISGTSRPRVLQYQVSPGEQAKSRQQKEDIEDYMLENKCTRDTVLLALGGGVVGDLTGFVAAT